MKGQFGERFWAKVQADRIVACINACDGIDPAKLAAFLEACKTLRPLERTYSMAPAPLSRWAAAYDALTGEGE
jgi:hypothetical protein